MDFKYKIGQNFKTEYKDLTVIDTIIKDNKKYYRYHCNRCGNEDITQETYINSLKYTCSVCAGNKTLKGYNDIHTTDEWMEKYLLDKNDAFIYSRCSNQRVRTKCPDCGKEGYIIPTNLYKARTIKCDCSDGHSLPERLMYYVLKYLEVDFIKEYRPSWSNRKRYDFYIPSLNIIIEMDGGMGHGYGNFGKKNELKMYNDIVLDKLKEDLAKENGIIDIIRINCKISNLNNVKEEILKSRLSEYMDLSNIDWIECMSNSEKNIVLEICNFYKDTKTKPREISDIYKIDYTTILRYLKRGTTYGWCEYNPKDSYKRRRNKQ